MLSYRRRQSQRTIFNVSPSNSTRHTGSMKLFERPEETLVGEAGDRDQGGYSSRGPEATPAGGHAAAARGRPAPAEGRRAARDGDDAATDCGELETEDGRRAADTSGLGGGGEGRAPLASAHCELATAPWAQPDGPRAGGGRERARGGPLGGRSIDADRAEPREPGGPTKTGEARGQGVTRTSSQRGGIAAGPHSQAPREEAPAKVEEIRRLPVREAR